MGIIDSYISRVTGGAALPTGPSAPQITIDRPALGQGGLLTISARGWYIARLRGRVPSFGHWWATSTMAAAEGDVAAAAYLAVNRPTESILRKVGRFIVEHPGILGFGLGVLAPVVASVIGVTATTAIGVGVGVAGYLSPEGSWMRRFSAGMGVGSLAAGALWAYRNWPGLPGVTDVAVDTALGAAVGTSSAAASALTGMTARSLFFKGLGIIGALPYNVGGWIQP